jgi:outer membrane cobalamin receptor
MLEKKTFTIKIVDKEEKNEYTSKRQVERDNNIITRRQIEESKAISLYELLKGRIPGLNIETVDGELKISLRGGTSIELSNEPLFIVDGTNYESSAEADRSVK